MFMAVNDQVVQQFVGILIDIDDNCTPLLAEDENSKAST
jgi:hypothetical protein